VEELNECLSEKSFGKRFDSQKPYENSDKELGLKNKLRSSNLENLTHQSLMI
jgi:hypothetical protein